MVIVTTIIFIRENRLFGIMALFEKGELKLLWPFYLEYFLASLLYFMPVFIVVYFLNIGLSATQIGILLGIWPLTTLLFEVPTGAFADLYGRKYSVLLGYFLEALVMISLFIWKEYSILLVLFAVLGIASTFSSGSKDAWIVDMINKKNKHLVHAFFSKMQFFIHFGLVFSGILGAILVKSFGLSIIWIMTALSYLLSIILLLIFTKEHYIKRKIKIGESFNELVKQTKTSLLYSYKHPVLFYFIISGVIAALAMCLQASITWTALIKGFGVPDYVLGYIWSGMGLMVAISPILAIKFLKKGKEKQFAILGMILCAVVLSLILFASNIMFAIAIMYASLFFLFSKSPAQEVYFHRFIPRKLRATIGSVKSMFLSISTIIGLPLAGFLVDKVGAKNTIFISALVMIPAILIFLKIKEKKHGQALA